MYGENSPFVEAFGLNVAFVLWCQISGVAASGSVVSLVGASHGPPWAPSSY